MFTEKWDNDEGSSDARSTDNEDYEGVNEGGGRHWGLSDDRGEVVEEMPGVVKEFSSHEVGRDEQGKDYHDEFYGKTESLFLDLSEGLKDTDAQTGDGCENNGRH